MIEIIGIKFEKNGRTHYYNPEGAKFSKGDGIIARTGRGVEYGVVSVANCMVSKKNIEGELSKIMRKASAQDIEKNDRLTREEGKALEICVTKIKEHKLDMKLCGVKFLFDESKIIFDFTAEARIDFRELVKSLASVWHSRIELRQIGARDETRCAGGIGMCGQPCCCTRYLGEIGKVSVKMAKNQNISLNPTKINGLCGRLLCCLGYENEHYVETLKEMPRVGTEIKTKDGTATVIYNNLLKKIVSARVRTGEDSFENKDYTLDEIISMQKPRPTKEDEKEESEESVNE